jgi:ceramide glucosyltransferase
VEYAAIGLGLLLFLATIWDHFRLRRSMLEQRAAARRLALAGPAGRILAGKPLPAITVVRPVRGLDVEAAKNLTAALDIDYPGEVETIFVFDDELDPAFAPVRQAIAAHVASGRPGTAMLMVAGSPPPTMTGKLHAMIAGLGHATGELVAFGDSDTRPHSYSLRMAVEKLLTTERAGSVFVPVVATEAPQTAGDAGAALMLNGLYGPAVANTVRKNGDMPFIMGQLMVFRRETLKTMHDLTSVSGELVDDMRIGMDLVAAGYRNLVTEDTLPVVIRGLGLLDFARMFRRWLIFSRSGLPTWSFKAPVWLRGAEFWLGFIMAAIALHHGQHLIAIPAAATVVAVSASMVRLHRILGGAAIGWRHAWVPAAILLLGPLVLVSAIIKPEVAWRGRTYQLDARSKLHRREAAPAHRT